MGVKQINFGYGNTNYVFFLPLGNGEYRNKFLYWKKPIFIFYVNYNFEKNEPTVRTSNYNCYEVYFSLNLGVNIKDINLNRFP